MEGSINWDFDKTEGILKERNTIPEFSNSRNMESGLKSC